MRVDFHVHSTASDGTFAPARLAELAQEWKFACLSLTDHDNMFFSFYDTSKNPPEKTSISQFPFLPIMLNYEYYF